MHSHPQWRTIKSFANSKHNGNHYRQNDTATKHVVSPTPYTLPEHFYVINATTPPSREEVAAERERIRMEFFATYDVMTGVRIAATLGGFFGLMVFLIIYKSRGETHETMKALKDPKIAAVAAAVMQEEEERELQEAMEATGMSIYPDDFPDAYLGYRRRRKMSLGNISAPPVLNSGYRLNSFGGSTMFPPPTTGRRFSYGNARYVIAGNFRVGDYFLESDGEEADDEFDRLNQRIEEDNEIPTHYQLSVPHKLVKESRRFSNITCCSSESSYLERRCSALTLGLSSLVPASQCSSTIELDTLRRNDNQQSPHASFDMRKRPQKSLSEQDSFESRTAYGETNIYHGKNHFDKIEEDELAESAALAQQISKLSRDNRYIDDRLIASTVNNTLKSTILQNRRAPLVTLSSLIVSSSVDNQDSLGSDSVFGESYADTDDDQFSDSDVNSMTATCSARLMRQRQANKATVCADIELIPHHPDMIATEVQQTQFGVGESNNDKLNNNRMITSPLPSTAATQISSRNSSHSSNTTSSSSSIANERFERKRVQSNKIKSSPPSPYDRTATTSVNQSSNVVDNRNRLSLIVNPSVILELPVMSASTSETIDASTNTSIDPCVSSTSRKWSKETLF